MAALSLGAKRVFLVQEGVPWGTKQPSAGDLSSGKVKVCDPDPPKFTVTSFATPKVVRRQPESDYVNYFLSRRRLLPDS